MRAPAQARRRVGPHGPLGAALLALLLALPAPADAARRRRNHRGAQRPPAAARDDAVLDAPGHGTADPTEADAPQGDPAGGADDAVESVDVGDDASAVKEGDDWYSDAYPQFDRVVDISTARTARKGAFNTLIQHRGSEGALRNPFYDLFGLDPGGIKVGLGVRYGILDGFDVGIYRINGTIETFDTYELTARYQLLQQARHRFDLLVHGGVSWFSAPGHQALGMLGQLIANRLVAGRALLGGGLMFHSKSTGPNKGQLDSNSSLALMGQADLRLSDNWSLATELTVNIAGYHDKYPVITISPKYISNRHTFAFIVSNSQYIDAAGIVANTWRISPLDWVLGFHITREI